jgi:S-DNA-T family DNA segregation ATPase FtsK/SpoIIIE
VDKLKAWSTASSRAKSAVVNTLDSLSPTFAPFAARWDAEADRRAKLRTPENLKKLMDAQRAHNSARSTAAAARSQRTAARRASRNPLSTGRRAARTADKAARQHRDTAKAALKSARTSYPSTLVTRAVQAHAAHAIPAGAASYALSTAHDLTVWPAGLSASLIALNAGALWLGRRTLTVQLDDGLSIEERQLVERLDPSYWVQHADERGLSGTVTTPPEVTAAGIECAVRLDGKWTVAGLQSAEAHVRALLGARTGLPMLIKDGPRGGWAVMVLRTRSAADDMETTWTPGASWGVDMVTGEEVQIPLGQRLLVAGRSGAGKSVATRPLLYAASEGDCDRLVLIDLKWIEARNWDHRARVATTPEQVTAVVAELVEEQTERLAAVPKGEETVRISPNRPRITVFVDEGAEVITSAKDAISGLESIARMGRAAEIHLVWATQKPSMSGASAGIPPQIAAQMSGSISLAVKTPADARVVFGDDAQSTGWDAHLLPAPGVALLRDGTRKPNPIRIRRTTPTQVVQLADRPIWHREAVPAEAAPEAAGARPVLRLVKDETETAAAVPAPREAETGPVTNRDRVLAAIRDGARTGREVTDRTGINKGTVSREVKALVEAGAVTRAEDGTLTATAGEVSA